MSDAWLIVFAVGAGTILIKAAGPVLLGSRSLPPPFGSAVLLLAPALLAGLVASTSVSVGSAIVLDTRLVGLGAAAVLIALRAPILLVVVVAAAAAAVARLAGAP